MLVFSSWFVTCAWVRKNANGPVGVLYLQYIEFGEQKRLWPRHVAMIKRKVLLPD